MLLEDPSTPLTLTLIRKSNPTPLAALQIKVVSDTQASTLHEDAPTVIAIEHAEGALPEYAAHDVVPKFEPRTVMTPPLVGKCEGVRLKISGWSYAKTSLILVVYCRMPTLTSRAWPTPGAMTQSRALVDTHAVERQLVTPSFTSTSPGAYEILGPKFCPKILTTSPPFVRLYFVNKEQSTVSGTSGQMPVADAPIYLNIFFASPPFPPASTVTDTLPYPLGAMHSMPVLEVHADSRHLTSSIKTVCP